MVSLNDQLGLSSLQGRNTIHIVQDYHAPINLAAFSRSPKPAIDENASDSNITQLPAALVISSPDLSDNEPASSPQCVQPKMMINCAA